MQIIPFTFLNFDYVFVCGDLKSRVQLCYHVMFYKYAQVTIIKPYRGLCRRGRLEMGIVPRSSFFSQEGGGPIEQWLFT